MKEWEVKTIKEIGKVVTGNTPPMAESKYFGGDYMFVSPKDLDYDLYYVKNTETKITNIAISKFKNQVIPPNTVMFTSLSYSFGKMGLTSQECITNQQINSIIVNDENDFKFIYYLLRLNQKYIFQYNSGIDTPIVPKSVFEKIKLSLPPLKTQQNIANILSAYDDLIETNTQRIKFLEETGQQLYKEWFVRMRFPDYKKVKFVKGVPEGWRILPFSNIANFINGFTFKPEDWMTEGLPIIKIAELKNGITEQTPYNFGKIVPKKYWINSGDILFSWSAHLEAYHWTNGEGLLNQHLFKVEPVENKYKPFIFYSLKDKMEEFRSLSNGATMQHIKKSALSQVYSLYPDSELVDNFNNYIEPILSQLIIHNQQNTHLRQIRDRLLPRLVSGQLAVKGEEGR